MADDNVIKVGTQVDVSGIQSGMAEAASITRAQLEVLKAQYRDAAAEVKQSASRIADAQKQAAEAASAGFTGLATSIQGFVAADRAALGGLADNQIQLKASIDQAKSALDGEGESFNRAGIAARLAAMEIGGIPRPLATLAGQSSALAPILAAAFPIIGAVEHSGALLLGARSGAEC